MIKNIIKMIVSAKSRQVVNSEGDAIIDSKEDINDDTIKKAVDDNGMITIKLINKDDKEGILTNIPVTYKALQSQFDKKRQVELILQRFFTKNLNYFNREGYLPQQQKVNKAKELLENLTDEQKKQLKESGLL